MNINDTINEYAQSIYNESEKSIKSPSSYSQLKTRGSKAVLSALRALQQKIASLNAENIQCKQKCHSIKQENNKNKAQIQELIELNETLSSEIKKTLSKEQKAIQIAQNAEHQLNANEKASNSKITSLQHQIEKLKKKSNQRRKLYKALKLCRDQIEKSKINISILKDEIHRQRSIKQSILKRNENSEKVISEMIQENQRLHSKILKLQKEKVKMNDNRKFKRSKSVHSIKQKTNKKPFIPTGKVNKTFSNLNYEKNHFRQCSKQKQKQKQRTRSTKMNQIKYVSTDNEESESCFLNEEYLNNLLNSTQNSEFDELDINGLDIDDIKRTNLQQLDINNIAE